MSAAVCAAEGCDRNAHVKGLCGMHHMRNVRNGTHTTAQPHHPQPPTCTTDGCTRPTAAKGMCKACYGRARRGPSSIKPITPEVEATVRELYTSTGSLLAVAREMHLGLPRIKRVLGITSPLPRGGSRDGRNRANPTPHPPTPAKAPTGIAYGAAMAPARARPGVTAESLGYAAGAPIRWPEDWTTTPDPELGRIAAAALARCSGDKREARKYLGAAQPAFDRALKIARDLGLA